MNTKKQTHTPGPWIFYDDGNGLSVCPQSCEDDLIPNYSAATNRIAKLPLLEGYSVDSLLPILKANAALIASAPEMLEALRATLIVYNCFQDRTADFTASRKLIEDAIAKAEGRDK